MRPEYCTLCNTSLAAHRSMYALMPIWLLAAGCHPRTHTYRHPLKCIHGLGQVGLASILAAMLETVCPNLACLSSYRDCNISRLGLCAQAQRTQSTSIPGMSCALLRHSCLTLRIPGMLGSRGRWTGRLAPPLYTPVTPAAHQTAVTVLRLKLSGQGGQNTVEKTQLQFCSAQVSSLQVCSSMAWAAWAHWADTTGYGGEGSGIRSAVLAWPVQLLLVPVH